MSGLLHAMCADGTRGVPGYAHATYPHDRGERPAATPLCVFSSGYSAALRRLAATSAMPAAREPAPRISTPVILAPVEARNPPDPPEVGALVSPAGSTVGDGVASATGDGSPGVVADGSDDGDGPAEGVSLGDGSTEGVSLGVGSDVSVGVGTGVGSAATAGSSTVP